jgi:D-glycero-alpha-D-manno-heptose-7-phosphate kinase
VLNCTIDRYAYTFIEPRIDGQIVFRARDISHEEIHVAGLPLDISTGLRLHRCVYNCFLIEGRLDPALGLTVTTSVDCPPGSGLGSSSALVVAMCEAFRFLCNSPLGLYELARLAFDVERVKLNLAGGKQDQYSATFGGVNFIEFLAGNRVIVNPLRVDRAILNEFEASLVICFTGVSRESEHIIRQQTTNMVRQDSNVLRALIDLKLAAIETKEALLSGDIPAVAEILNRSWESKKQTAGAISSHGIDALVATGRNAGAIAAKISGAGGGGFIMFLAPPEQRLGVIEALNRASVHASPVHLTSRGVEAWQMPLPT